MQLLAGAPLSDGGEGVTATLRILLIEDSANDAKLVAQELRRLGRPIEIERVETADAMREALKRRPWDIVLSDWSLPKFSGPAALAVMQELESDLPFVIVSGTVGEEAAVDAMRGGAHDYVLKDRLARLVPAVERELREHKNRRARREAEEALRASNDRFSRLTSSGIVAILFGDVTGEILEANDAFLQMVGYSRDDLVAGELRWSDLTPPEWKAATDRGLEELRTRGVATPYEKEFVRKDGSRVPILIGIAMLGGSRTLGFMVDLTSQKRTERALELSEEQLRQAQKMEAVGRLAGGVAHDFNNVLSVILGYAEMLLVDLKPGDPTRGDIEEMRRAGERAADLTRQLLMFSRRQVLAPTVIDINDVLSRMDRMLQRILGADVNLVSLPVQSLGRVRADQNSLEQVILNLVVNARDAMPNGGTLTMSTAEVVLDDTYASAHLGATPGPHVLLEVSDTGTGIEKEMLSRIFEPFFTTKESGKGTGLGLSTVFGVVQQSGGTISVESEVGTGTTFKIYLPRVDAPVDAQPASAARSMGLRGSETILLVDDDPQVRAVAKSILKRCGYYVIEAGNAGEALLHAEAHVGPIHLLLTDVVMPQLSGPALARRLASVRPEMKVLCMSGYTDDSVVRHGVLEAHLAYLQKPITPDALAAKVREVLGAAGAGATRP